MKRSFRFLPAFAGLALAAFASGQPADLRLSPRTVDVRSADGTLLEGTFFAAGKPGPGALLFHQSDRTRQSWADVAARLAGAGISTLAIDARGHGDSVGKRASTPEERERRWAEDIDAAFQWLGAQPGIDRSVVGLGGAGVIGVEAAVDAARRHPEAVKSLVLMSGETDRRGYEFLRDSPRLPELFVAADEDEYPPIVEAMELLYVTASSPERKLVHYPAAHEAPWLWYEPFDVGKVPPTGGHGTDLFAGHPDLPESIVSWFETTLVVTPGHAPADTLASAAVLNEIRSPGGAARVSRRLAEARKSDPHAQLFPEIAASTIGQGDQRAGDTKAAIDVLELVVLAYPDSADAHANLAEAYLAGGRTDAARRHAEKALALLDSHASPASSWTDTEAYRGEIRKGAKETLEKSR
jgi:dienelactone hydrolase